MTPTPSNVEIPNFHGELLPFQVEDVAKLIQVPASLNCNEMGCGKTIEAIAMDTIYRNHHGGGATLVIAPLAAVDDAWERWLTELTNVDFTLINVKNRERSWANFTSGNGDVFVTHWQSLLKMPELASYKWMHVIADECHYIQNHVKKKTHKLKDADGNPLMVPKVDKKTGEPCLDDNGEPILEQKIDVRPTTTDAFKKIKAPRKLAMSGTPLDSLPARLWSVLNWLYPKKYTSYWRFFNTYIDYEKDWHGYRKIKGIHKHMMPQLHAEIAPFFVRHLKEEVVPDMPEKYYSVLTPALTTPQQRQYKGIARDMMTWANKAGEEELLTASLPITQFTKLHQIANATIELDQDDNVKLVEPSNKIDCLVEDVLNLTHEPVIVFTAGTKFLDLVESRMRKERISYVRVDGSTSRMARTAAIDRFQAGKARVFLGTIRAAGASITLTAATTTVFLDETDRADWNAQAEDRAWRIGQKNAVHIIRIRSKGTVDQKREKRLVRKVDWFRETLGDGVDRPVKVL